MASSKSVVLTQEARNNIDAILESVYQYTGFVSTPQKLLKEFTTKFQIIGLVPKGGKLQSDGTRITFCRHYRIVYREFDDKVEIITVVHSRQLYPKA